MFEHTLFYHLAYLFQFVAHPSCQQRLDRSWFEGTGPFLKAGILKRIVMIQMFILAYPFLTFLYIFTPDKKLKVTTFWHI